MHEFAAGIYHFDSLPATGVLESAHLLRGWLVTKQHQPFVDVRVLCAGREIPSVYGLPRADLAQFFKTSRPFLPAEFEFRVDLAPGQFELQLEAFDLSGRWLPVTTVRLTVVAAERAPSTPEPGRSLIPLRAFVFNRALEVTLQDSGENHSTSAETSESTPRLVRATPWPAVARDPHRPFHGFLDEPAAISRCKFGRVHVSGWLFHETVPLRTVVASFDLIGFERLEHGGPFPGVAARYPHFPAGANSRLRGVVDAPSQLASRACLRVYAELTDGSWHLCHAQRTGWIDQEQEKRPLLPGSARFFIRRARNLRRAYREVGTLVETGPAARAELWKTWRRYSDRAPRPYRADPRLPPLKPAAAGAGPRRLLLVTHNLALEGASLFLWEYAQQWRRVGATISVVSPHDGPLRSRYEALGAKIQIVDTASFAQAQTASELRKEMALVGQSIAWKNSDLVVANTLACYWAIHAARAAGSPTLFYLHESTTPERFFEGHLHPAALPVVEEAFALATRVSFLAEASRRYSKAFCRENASINPGWLDLSAINAFRERHPPTNARAFLGLRPEERLIINVGTICDRKGQTLFARMVELLWQRDPKTAATCRFAIVGGRRSLYDTALASLVRDLGRPNVQIVPETNDVFPWYAAADIFACSSFEESFPRVILEAMGFGLGIVSTNVQAIPEMVRESQEALLFPAGHTSAGADALQRLLTEPGLARKLGAAARSRVESNYTIERIFPQHQAFAVNALSA